MALDFAKLLAKKVDDIKPPPVLPEGTYRGVVTKYEFVESQQKKTPGVKVTFRFLSAEDDVDAEELKEIENLATIERSTSFWITENSEFMLAEFIKSCGISTQGRSLSETIPELQNANILIKVAHRLNPDNPERKLVDIKEIVGA